MPYIKERDRIALRSRYPETPGELNYNITMELIKYMEVKGLSYQTINDIVGAIEGAKQEFYRRVAAPYENTKISQNGDVYNWSSTQQQASQSMK